MEEYKSNLKQSIEETIAKNKVVVYSKSFCPYCRKVKRILTEKNVIFKPVDLDLMGDAGIVIQSLLRSMTGQATVPSIFINGQHVGGCSHLEELEACCALDELIEGRPMEHFDFDIVVIGGGSGGLACGKEASRYGKKVAICDIVTPSPAGTKWGLGGTCTNVGCVPKKLMHLAAVMKSDLMSAPAFGWPVEMADLEHNWTKLAEAIRDYIKSLNWKNRRDLVSMGITYYNAMASFVDNHTLKLVYDNGDEKTVTAQNFVIAVGCRPRYLDIPGIDLCVTSDDIFTLPESPGKTMIVGAGFVALECASFLNSFGCDVTLMVRSKMLNSPDFDRDIVEKLQEEMEQEGIKFIWGYVITGVFESGSNKKVEGINEEGEKYEDYFETVMLAVGRVPGTRKLGLDNVGIKLCSNDKVPTNKKDQTKVKNIFAIGDCAFNRPELTPVAVVSGKFLAKRLCRIECHQLLNYRMVPKTVFTWPEYGAVGESEATAIEANGAASVICYSASFRPLETAMVRPYCKSFAKIVCVVDQDKEERIVGMHLMSPNAGEAVQGFAMTVLMGARKKDLDALVAIHPTCAQAFTMLSPMEEKTNTEDNESAC